MVGNDCSLVAAILVSGSSVLSFNWACASAHPGLGSGMRCASPRLGSVQLNSMQPGRIWSAFILAFVIGHIINMFATFIMFFYVSLCIIWFGMV